MNMALNIPIYVDSHDTARELHGLHGHAHSGAQAIRFHRHADGADMHGHPDPRDIPSGVVIDFPPRDKDVYDPDPDVIESDAVNL